MYELALFAGAGGGILGGMLSGFTCVGACEIEEYPRSVLLARQRDGFLPRFPIWDDICTFRSDNAECSEYFDFLRSIREQLVITGGFPCQDISAAGGGAGIEGKKSGLWKEMLRIINEIRPVSAFMENSPMLVRRGLTIVISDLCEIGYDSKWCVLGADDLGAPHRRKRIWIRAKLGDTERKGLEGYSRHVDGPKGRAFESGSASETNLRKSGVGLADAKDEGNVRRDGQLQPDEQACRAGRDHGAGKEVNDCRKWWDVEPNFPRVANGVAHRVDRLKAIGNGQVPIVAATAWELLK